MDIATKALVGVRPADKVLQALASLAALIDSTIREVKSLDNEFDTRLLQIVQETEKSLQAQTAEQVERARQEVQEELRLRHQQELQTTVNAMKSEFEAEREHFNKELMRTGENASNLESEKSGLLKQVQQMKADFAAEIEKAREDLKDAVQKTEVLLKAETAESIERERQRVQDELAGKYQEDLQAALQGLKSEFEIECGRLITEVQQVKAASAVEIEDARENMRKAVHDTELSLQAQAAENIAHARQEVEDALNSKYRKDLQAALEGLQSEFEVERGRLNKELHHTVEVASKLESERSGLISELQKAREEADEAKAVAASQPSTAAASAPPASLQQEIARAESKLQEILKLIDNPATELSTVIRKNVEKSELEAYLKGIRLALDSLR